MEENPEVNPEEIPNENTEDKSVEEVKSETEGQEGQDSDMEPGETN